MSERRGIAWIIAIIAVSAGLGMLVEWRAPGISRYAHDWLMQLRGTLPVPDDIEQRVAEILEERPALRWDAAVQEILEDTSDGAA